MTRQIKIHFLYGFIVLFALFSCRSVRQDTEIRDLEKVNVRCDSAMKSCISSVISEDLRFQQSQNEQMEVEFLFFTPPDAAGRQFLRAKANLTKRSESAAHAVQNHTADNFSERDFSTNSEAEHITQSETHQQKSKNSKFSAIKFYVTSSAFMLLLLFVLFQYKKIWRKSTR